MTKALKLLRASLLFLGAALVAQPALRADMVVNFDDLTTDRAQVADGYGGINWGGSFLLFTDHYAPYLHRIRTSTRFTRRSHPPLRSRVSINSAS